VSQHELCKTPFSSFVLFSFFVAIAWIPIPGRDPALESDTRMLEKRYKELGGSITVIIKEGEGHYPLTPKDPKPVVEFIAAKAR